MLSSDKLSTAPRTNSDVLMEFYDPYLQYSNADDSPAHTYSNLNQKRLDPIPMTKKHTLNDFRTRMHEIQNMNVKSPHKLNLSLNSVQNQHQFIVQKQVDRSYEKSLNYSQNRSGAQFVTKMSYKNTFFNKRKAMVKKCTRRKSNNRGILINTTSSSTRKGRHKK